MKKICGFEDKNGVFHKTEKKCKIAEARIRIKEVERTLISLSNDVSDIIFRSEEKYKRSIYDIKNDIKKQVAKTILRDSEKFENIIKQKKNLKNELDLLKKQDKYNTWWLQFKWW